MVAPPRNGLAMIGWPFYRARNPHPRWTWPWYRQHIRKYGVCCCTITAIGTLVAILLMYLLFQVTLTQNLRLLPSYRTKQRQRIKPHHRSYEHHKPHRRQLPVGSAIPNHQYRSHLSDVGSDEFDDEHHGWRCDRIHCRSNGSGNTKWRRFVCQPKLCDPGYPCVRGVQFGITGESDGTVPCQGDDDIACPWAKDGYYV
jgi:hypothetical protein